MLQANAMAVDCTGQLALLAGYVILTVIIVVILLVVVDMYVVADNLYTAAFGKI